MPVSRLKKNKQFPPAGKEETRGRGRKEGEGKLSISGRAGGFNTLSKGGKENLRGGKKEA